MVDVAADLTQDGLAALVAEETGEPIMEVAAEIEEPIRMVAEKVHLLDLSLEAVELLGGDDAGDLLEAYICTKSSDGQAVCRVNERRSSTSSA